jgi:hypothetical protein
MKCGVFACAISVSIAPRRLTASVAASAISKAAAATNSMVVNVIVLLLTTSLRIIL